MRIESRVRTYALNSQHMKSYRQFFQLTKAEFPKIRSRKLTQSKLGEMTN